MGQASNEIVIDLGELPERELDQLAPDHRARWAQPWLAAICVVALVGGVVGSAPVPASPWATPRVINVGQATDQGVLIAGDLLIVPGPGPRRSVTAWNLRDGSKRWSFETDLDRLFDAEMVSGLVVISGYREVPEVPERHGDKPVAPSSRTYALDPGTGAKRWDGPGTALLPGRSPDRLLLVDHGVDGFVAAAVDPASGAELWRFDGRDNSSLSLSSRSWDSLREATPDIDEALVSRPDGTLRFLSLITGETARLGELPTGATAIMDFDDTTVTVEQSNDTDGDPSTGPEESLVITYDRATMRELWRTAANTTSGRYFGRCGTLICEMTEQGTTARDLRTGGAVWSARVFPHRLWERPGGDLLIAQSSENENALLDPATGRERLALRRWQLIGEWAGALLVGLPREAGQPSWLGLIPATGDPRIRPISAIGLGGGRLDNCMVEREWLTCWALTDLVVVNLTDAMQGR